MDKISAEKRSRNMQRIKNKNTKPEIAIRKLLFGLGFRYRIHNTKLPGKPDIVFRKRKKVIFVHGCFWHKHNRNNCKYTHVPKSNQSYWNPKLEKNQQRDKSNQIKLKAIGWDYFIIWECEVKSYLENPSPVINFLNS